MCYCECLNKCDVMKCSRSHFNMDTCAVLLCTEPVGVAICPALVLDLSPHWGQDESPDGADWSQYEPMHRLQNRCPQLAETGSFRTS